MKLRFITFNRCVFNLFYSLSLPLYVSLLCFPSPCVKAWLGFRVLLTVQRQCLTTGIGTSLLQHISNVYTRSPRGSVAVGNNIHHSHWVICCHYHSNPVSLHVKICHLSVSFFALSFSLSPPFSHLPFHCEWEMNCGEMRRLGRRDGA